MARKSNERRADTDADMETKVIDVPVVGSERPLATSVTVTPVMKVRDLHAALYDAITQARVAGYVVTGDLDRIAISATAKAH